MTFVTDVEADTAFFNAVMDPAGRAEPYPHYEVLRGRAPRLQSVVGVRVIAGYEDAMTALRHPDLGRGIGMPERTGSVLGGPESGRHAEFFERSRHQMLLADPPDHTRLRRLASRAFTPRRAEELRPAVEQIMRGLLDEVTEGDEIDVMEVLALPFPMAVIGTLVGVPAPDWLSFQPLVRAAALGIEPAISDEQLAAATSAMDKLGEYFTELLQDRRRRPTGDLLCGLLEARDQDDTLTDEEITSTAILLFAAGFETTMNLIGNGLLALLRHPDQMRRWRDDPSLGPSAVDELLRWDSPVQLNMRTALRPTEIFGEAIPPGTTFIILQGSANRDPSRFDHADRFDVVRPDNGPLSFGSGIHHCIGAALARMEGEVAFGALLDRFATITLLDDSPPWRPTFTLRGLSSLPVRVGA